MENELVQITPEGRTITTSLAIAEGTDHDHASILKILRQYDADFKEIGEVRFEIRLNKQGSPTEYALINEQQVTLMFMYMRNNEKIRQFKKILNKAFWAMSERLNGRDSSMGLTKPQLAVLLMESERNCTAQKALLEEKDKIIAAFQEKAETLDTIWKAEGEVCLSDAAKLCQAKPRKTIALLKEWGWIYKRKLRDAWIANQEKINQGLMSHRLVFLPGGKRTKNQLFVTNKGLVRISELINKGRRLEPSHPPLFPEVVEEILQEVLQDRPSLPVLQTIINFGGDVPRGKQAAL